MSAFLQCRNRLALDLELWIFSVFSHTITQSRIKRWHKTLCILFNIWLTSVVVFIFDFACVFHSALFLNLQCICSCVNALGDCSASAPVGQRTEQKQSCCVFSSVNTMLAAPVQDSVANVTPPDFNHSSMLSTQICCWQVMTNQPEGLIVYN